MLSFDTKQLIPNNEYKKDVFPDDFSPIKTIPFLSSI